MTAVASSFLVVAAVMPLRRPSLPPSSVPVWSLPSPSSERRAVLAVVAVVYILSFVLVSQPPKQGLSRSPPTLPRRRSALALPSAPLSSPAVVAVVAAGITAACSRPIRPPSSSSRRHRRHLRHLRHLGSGLLVAPKSSLAAPLPSWSDRRRSASSSSVVVATAGVANR